MRPDGPRLALIGAESALRDQAHEVLSQVWTGQIRAVDTVPADAVVVVLVTQNVDDGLRLAARLDGPLVARIPVLLVTLDGARRLRTIALPAPVAWVLNGNELDPRMVGLAIRYALEVGTRWRLGDQVQALKPLADVGTITTVTSHEISNALTSLLLTSSSPRRSWSGETLQSSSRPCSATPTKPPVTSVGSPPTSPECRGRSAA